MVQPMVVAAGVQAGLSFFGGLGRSKSKKRELKRQADERRRRALEAGQRLTIRLASARRATNRLQGSRRAAVAASGQTRSGSALEVLFDRAREDENTIDLMRMEGQQQINAIMRGAAVLTKQAAEINPMRDALFGAVGSLTPFADDIADAFRTPTTTTATTVLTGGTPQSGAGRIPGVTGP